MKQGWEVRNYEVQEVTVVPDDFQKGEWVTTFSPDGDSGYYLSEGTTLFFDRRQALKAALDQVHYERRRLERLEAQLQEEYFDDTVGVGQTGTEG